MPKLEPIVYGHSPEYTRRGMLRFFLKTSIPRLLKQQREKGTDSKQAV